MSLHHADSRIPEITDYFPKEFSMTSLDTVAKVKTPPLAVFWKVFRRLKFFSNLFPCIMGQPGVGNESDTS